MVAEGYVPSFQCKMNLDRFTSMGEIDGLVHIFIGFYVARLTRRRHFES